MPFENSLPPSRIAVIGAGISGMGAAHALARDHRVTLFESEPRLGGHARTVEVAGEVAGRGPIPVDTGFIVFNEPNYPNLVRLFAELGVPARKSDMSFGVSAEGGRVEYALSSLSSLFAQRRNAVNPNFLRMLVDILRWNARAVEAARDPSMTLGELLQRLRLGAWFQRYYLLPFSGAIWSTPPAQMLAFPALALTRFFQNHHLLSVYGQHQWYTVDGGSVEYVRRLQASLRARGCEIRLKAPVQAVRRHASGVEVRAAGGAWERFDHVVLACHSDTALSLLADPSPEETALLGAIRYQPNRAVLHSDTSIMPRRRACWASWTYTTEAHRPEAPVGVTYWMNSLQPHIPAEVPIFGSLNPSRALREELVHEETTFRHPVFDRAALEAQPRIHEMQGRRNTWFCGAWLRNGFHEDGLWSGLQVAERLGEARAWA